MLLGCQVRDIWLHPMDGLMHSWDRPNGIHGLEGTFGCEISTLIHKMSKIIHTGVERLRLSPLGQVIVHLEYRASHSEPNDSRRSRLVRMPLRLYPFG